jgi:uncharacterized RDD family membrane protein YckC
MTGGLAPVPYAGAVTRSLAFGLDLLIINAAIAITGAVLGLVASALGLGKLDVNGVVVAALVGLWWVILGTYLVTFWTLVGQTPGMRVMRLRVTTPGGRRPHLVRSLVRLVGMVLAAIPLMAGYALILFNDRRQGFHDKLARTTVIYVPEEVEAELDATAVEVLAPTRAIGPGIAGLNPPSAGQDRPRAPR